MNNIGLRKNSVSAEDWYCLVETSNLLVPIVGLKHDNMGVVEVRLDGCEDQCGYFDTANRLAPLCKIV